MQTKPRLAHLVLIFLAACLILAGASVAPPETTHADTLAEPVLAATCASSSPTNTFTITGITPAKITAGSSITILIAGSGFATGAHIQIENFGGLTTTVDSATQLAGVVPGNIKAGKYNVIVTDADGNSCTLSKALTVASNTPKSTNTPEPTTFVRPQTQVVSYSPSPKNVYPGENLDFVITLQSVGQITARQVTATFVTGDMVPRETGGVHFAGDMDPGATTTFPQPLRVSSQISKGEAVMKLQVVYYDDFGKEYTDNFDVAVFPIAWGSAATATPTLAVHPQIALTDYKTTPPQLGPGTVFQLDLDLTNLSGDLARQVVLNLGGNTNSTSTSSSSLILPVNSSSSRYVEQMEVGATAHVTFNMAVSGSATGQFVPMELGVSYYDSANNQHSQTENISLRIDTVPFLFIHFLTPPPTTIQVGETLDLPVEVINIGASKLNVSTIEVTSEQMSITDGSLYVGPLDAGTSGTVPSQLTAQQAGVATVTVTIHYLDDYQQSQIATKDLILHVEEQPTPTPDLGGTGDQQGGRGGSSELSPLDRIFRAILGFFGLSTRDTGGFGGGVTPGGSNGGNGGGGGAPGGGRNGGNGGVAGG